MFIVPFWLIYAFVYIYSIPAFVCILCLDHQNIYSHMPALILAVEDGTVPDPTHVVPDLWALTQTGSSYKDKSPTCIRRIHVFRFALFIITAHRCTVSSSSTSIQAETRNVLDLSCYLGVLFGFGSSVSPCFLAKNIPCRGEMSYLKNYLVVTFTGCLWNYKMRWHSLIIFSCTHSFDIKKKDIYISSQAIILLLLPWTSIIFLRVSKSYFR